MVQLGTTIILARVLSPSDFGLVGMVVAFTALVGLFRDLGLGSAAVQAPETTHLQLSLLYWLNILIGGGLTLILAALAPAVAAFYGVPELRELTLVLSLTLVIGSAGAVHSALLQRNLKFGRKGSVAVAGAGTTAAVSICMAVAGFDYWALASGILAGTTASTILNVLLSGFSPSLPRGGQGIAPLVRFGAYVTSFQATNYLHRNLDNVLVGKFWGAASLGYYGRAYQIFMLPITLVRDPIFAVAFPAMSRLWSDPATYRIFVRRTAVLIGMATVPLAAFMIVAAEPLVQVVLGNQWLSAAPVLAVLSIAGVIQPTASLRGLVLLSSGQGRRYMQWGLMNASAVSAGFALGVPWGPQGVALGYCVATYVILVPSLHWCFKGTSVRVSDFFSALAKPTAASAVAVLACTFLESRFSEGSGQATHLLALTLVFATAYSTIFLLLPGGVRDARYVGRLVRTFWSSPTRATG